MAADELPPEAHAIALAMLPAMGPARLLACTRAWGPAEAWRRVRAGDGAIEPAVAAAMGRGAAELAQAWARAAAAIDPAGALSRHHAAGVRVSILGGAEYPDALVNDPEPPALLCSLGDVGCVSGARVAIVGTRRCSRTGADIARELGYELAAAGVAVVSGLALGIDGAAHRGALAAGAAPPVGIVGSGLDVVYPRHHAELWRRVAERGVLLGEAPLGARPEAWRFPARNRIVAGVSDLVVVVESHAAGGSMHTVDEADRRGIDVMAVPGSTRSPASAGTNDLLAEGRAPVRDAGDVLVALGLTAATRASRADVRPAPDAADLDVLAAFDWRPATLEQLVTRCAAPIAAVSLALGRLEAAGWVCADGGWYERTGPAG
jgi:DNA processing protein